jgi:hypothetical protein
MLTPPDDRVQDRDNDFHVRLLSKWVGAPRWIRTTDLRIRSPSLYPLSYRGK